MDFKAIYNRDNFIEFFRDKLLPEDFSQQTEIIEPDFKSNYYQEITFLGNSPSLDLNVYEIKHSSEKDARVGLSRDAFKLVSRFSENNALILFVPENTTNFRLSLVTIDPKLDAKGVKILKEYSNPRRYSFVLGADAKTHTPEQYLIRLGRISDITDLKKRFSVEVVNKEFYGQIAEMFSKLVGGKRKKGNRTVEYQRTLELPSVSAENDQKHKEFAVRLIGRTVFCWFLKKKKSDNNIPLIDNDVLSLFAADSTPNFYHARVEPLFFEILNTAVEKRKPEYQKTPFDTIPFLNGGLFEPHTDDYYVKGTPNYALKIPDDWWKELLEILETYNFTIDENTSIDIDLSVDPEMLGRIFENLLAEINPETGETARKATGSYYTPRPIVEYMVDQSIKQYLSTKTNIDKEQIDVLLDYSNESSGLTAEEEKQVLEAINTIKVLDPACGSGAFPMGMLQKLLLVLQKVDHGAVSSVQQILNDITDPIKRDLIKRKLEAAQVLNDKDFDDYARKLSVIQRSIYGVDIQPIAADISRLRFFLSLIVDEVIQDEMPNRGIEPLPNLEFKFVCANTLIPLPEPDSFEKMFGDTEIVQEIEEIRTKYFTASNDDKPALKRQFEDLQKKLFNFLSKNKEVLSNPNSRLALLSAWKPFSDIASPWFDAKWMFGIDGGFDIVIGNPPYGVKISRKKNPVFKLLYEEILQGEIESYIIFYTRGLRILNNYGSLCYISPDGWLTNGRASSFRKWLISNYFIIDVFDCYKPFEGAKDTRVHTVLISSNSNVSRIKIKQALPSNTSYVYRNYSVPADLIKQFNQKEWHLYLTDEERQLFSKIESKSKTLTTVYNIRYGLRTGNNSKYFTNKETKYPLIAGADISSLYKINWTPKYLKTIEGLPQGYFNKYFADKKIILQYVRTNSLKINARWLEAAYVEGDFIPLNSLNYFYEKRNDYQLKYLLALLNSYLFNRYYRAYYTDVNVKPTYLSELPIYPAKKIIQDLLINKVTIITNNDNPDKIFVNSLQIDLMIYKLYELTYAECRIIDPEIEKKISQKDYKRLNIEGLSKYEIK